MSSEREMTLDEWMARLASGHRARRELEALRAELAELRESIEEWADELTWADGLCETPAKMRQALARHQQEPTK